MGPRKRHLPFVVAAGIGVLLIGAPAHSQAPTTASIVASDNAFTASGGGAADVTIEPGGTVEFSYPTGNSAHNVAFTGAQPSSCTQTAGRPSTGANPPLPNPAGGPGWRGQCTFTNPGTYAFVCEPHRNIMSGSVTVPGPVGGSPPPPPADPSPQPAPAPSPPGTAGPAASGLRVAGSQRGVAIRGSVMVTRVGSRLLARAFARRKALSGGRSAVQVQVGRQLRSSVGGKRVAFTVPLSAVARRALRRNGRLAISLRLTVTPHTGAAYTATRSIALRPR